MWSGQFLAVVFFFLIPNVHSKDTNHYHLVLVIIIIAGQNYCGSFTFFLTTKQQKSNFIGIPGGVYFILFLHLFTIFTLLPNLPFHSSLNCRNIHNVICEYVLVPNWAKKLGQVLFLSELFCGIQIKTVTHTYHIDMGSVGIKSLCVWGCLCVCVLKQTETAQFATSSLMCLLTVWQIPNPTNKTDSAVPSRPCHNSVSLDLCFYDSWVSKPTTCYYHICHMQYSAMYMNASTVLSDVNFGEKLKDWTSLRRRIENRKCSEAWVLYVEHNLLVTQQSRRANMVPHWRKRSAQFEETIIMSEQTHPGIHT